MEKEKRRRGDIVWVDLGEHPGTKIQSGRKLCLIVSTNKGSGSVYQVIPGTSKQEKKDFPVTCGSKAGRGAGVIKKRDNFYGRTTDDCV